MKARDKPRNCTECGKYHTCTDVYYGSINCKPEPAVNPDREYGGERKEHHND